MELRLRQTEMETTRNFTAIPTAIPNQNDFLDMILRAQESSVRLQIENELSRNSQNVSSTGTSSSVSLNQPLVPAPNISGISVNSNQPLLPQQSPVRAAQNSPVQIARNSPVRITRNSSDRRARYAQLSNATTGATALPNATTGATAMIHAPPTRTNIRPHRSRGKKWPNNPLFHSTRDSGLEVSNPLFGQNSIEV
jgi:hypothetical protein